MTAMKFYKYQGAGNDFIIIDNRELQFKSYDISLVAQLCNRKFGIGADGLMLLTNSGPAPEVNDRIDFEMLYYNADGRPGSMCGNGGRCLVAFAKKLGIIKNEARFMAMDGVHYASINSHGDWVSLQMIDVNKVEKVGEDYVINTGSPHYVKIVENLEEYDVYAKGKEIRNQPTFQADGINVNFVEKEGKGYFVRTYERGVEDETLACGTGVTAVAIAMAKATNSLGDNKIPIRVLGGELTIRFHATAQDFTQVYLEGPATFVFEGSINLSKPS